MQLDESTDVSNMAQLMVFARSCFKNEIHKELLFCEPLKKRCNRRDIFSTNNFFNKDKKTYWRRCILNSK